MAKIKLKFGQNEIEIESRDFYVDNETIGEVIERVTTHLEENRARIVYDSEKPLTSTSNQSSIDYLNSLDNAEFHEPEYTPPIPIVDEEIIAKLQILEKNSFFNQPRTVAETVGQLREYGWASSPLSVAKALAKMAIKKEIIKNSNENRTFYFAKAVLTT